jgi:hypothetical protein
MLDRLRKEAKILIGRLGDFVRVKSGYEPSSVLLSDLSKQLKNGHLPYVAEIDDLSSRCGTDVPKRFSEELRELCESYAKTLVENEAKTNVRKADEIRQLVAAFQIPKEDFESLSATAALLDTPELSDFDELYFSLLKESYAIVERMNVGGCGGMSCFAYLKEELFKTNREKRFETEGEMIARYKDFWARFEDVLADYFAHTLRILTCMEKAGLQYPSSYNSVLCPSETVILFHHGLALDRRFKPLIEQFALMDYLDTFWIRNKNHLRLYDVGAFGTRVESILSP